MPKDDTQANEQAGESWHCTDLGSEEDFSLESDEIFRPDIAPHLTDEEMEAEFAYIEKCFSEMSLIN